MNITEIDSETLAVTGLKELSGSGAATVRDTIRAALRDPIRKLDLDLSLITFIDSSGLGALIALLKTQNARGGQIRLLNPSPVARQILELTRLHRTFEIVTA